MRVSLGERVKGWRVCRMLGSHSPTFVHNAPFRRGRCSRCGKRIFGEWDRR